MMCGKSDDSHLGLLKNHRRIWDEKCLPRRLPPLFMFGRTWAISKAWEIFEIGSWYPGSDSNRHSKRCLGTLFHRGILNPPIEDRVLRSRGWSLRMVPGVGLEPTQCFHRGILNPLRLPISPPGQGLLTRRRAFCPRPAPVTIAVPFHLVSKANVIVRFRL